MHFCAFTNSDPTYVAYFSKNALQEENLNSSVQQFSICKRIQAVEQPFFFWFWCQKSGRYSYRVLIPSPSCNRKYWVAVPEGKPPPESKLTQPSQQQKSQEHEAHFKWPAVLFGNTHSFDSSFTLRFGCFPPPEPEEGRRLEGQRLKPPGHESE